MTYMTNERPIRVIPSRISQLRRNWGMTRAGIVSGKINVGLRAVFRPEGVTASAP